MAKVLYVQIKCELGQAYAVAEHLIDDIAETAEVYSTSGAYDLLSKFHLDEGQSVGEFVNFTLHRVAGIRDTQSILTFKLFGAPEGVRLDETDFRAPKA